MRLRGCIALELSCVVVFATGAAFAGDRFVQRLKVEQVEAPGRIVRIPPKKHHGKLSQPIQASLPPIRDDIHSPVFDGVNNEVLLDPLRYEDVKSVRVNHGGTSLSLRLDFEGGARAAFKPRQVWMQSQPRKEVAAYRMNLLLGLNAVAPAVGRAFRADELISKLDKDSRYQAARLRKEMIIRQGEVHGELSWWIPVIRYARISGHEVDSTEGVVAWMRLLRGQGAIPEKELNMAKQISDVLVFDFLINNPDRWSGGNARMSGDKRKLYFMDNTMSFGLESRGHSKVRAYLERSEKFSRSLIERVRAMNEIRFRNSVSYDVAPFEYLLTDSEIAAVMERRKHLLAYIDALIEQKGESTVLAFP